MMQKNGVKGLLYRYFRCKEKKLYTVSDYIGCMSQANVDYLLRQDSELDPAKVELCPNSVEPLERTITAERRRELRAMSGVLAVVLLICVNFMAMIQTMESAAW